MRKIVFSIICILNACVILADSSIISSKEFIPNHEERLILKSRIERLDEMFDEKENMLLFKVDSWNYHTDAIDTVYHKVRESLHYAVALFDYGESDYVEKGIKILRKVIPLQDSDAKSKYCGVWPYYLEEPLKTKKSPVDFNMADFNAVSLLDIYIYHYDKLPEDLRKSIKESLILAAKSIQKRNIHCGYTNIAIMGTYVTYMVSDMFDLSSMKKYARNRLKNFYNYTIQNRGYKEYNSPTYTIVALNELCRMKRHIVDTDDAAMINKLYWMAWDMIARHYHIPTAQLAGPHSRAYSAVVSEGFHDILYSAVTGKYLMDDSLPDTDVKVKHKVPDDLIHYLVDTKGYPRVEVDTFENVQPKIVGTCFLTDKYALSTVSRSCMWSQRHPYIAYWGDKESTNFFNVRFLHDGYDFSSGFIETVQNKNKTLSLVTLMKDGGDKHISIDKIKDGYIYSKDFRLRFEFGNTKSFKLLNNEDYSELDICVDGLYMKIYPVLKIFGSLKGRWEISKNEGVMNLDYVFYSGGNILFDFNVLKRMVFAFGIEFSDTPIELRDKISLIDMEDKIYLKWDNMSLNSEVHIKSGITNY